MILNSKQMYYYLCDNYSLLIYLEQNGPTYVYIIN